MSLLDIRDGLHFHLQLFRLCVWDLSLWIVKHLFKFLKILGQTNLYNFEYLLEESYINSKEATSSRDLY